jgi:hypothetical protein
MTGGQPQEDRHGAELVERLMQAACGATLRSACPPSAAQQ